ncbi:THUMP domain-containing protein [Silvimonas soli]|uniref:THUMP domain-containing protein n=1 Tax=Silvimonas soli TaxID=2980100 RepID=UPI0027E48AFE|nr:THUMP domain-containing protein [Silvimonas soli]
MSEKKTLKLPPTEAQTAGGNARRPARPAGRAAAFSGGQASKPYAQDPTFRDKTAAAGGRDERRPSGPKRDERSGGGKPYAKVTATGDDGRPRSPKPYGDRPAGDRSGGFNRDERRPDQRRDDRPAGDRPPRQFSRDERNPDTRRSEQGGGDKPHARPASQERSFSGQAPKSYGAKPAPDRTGGFNRDERRPEPRRDERTQGDRPAYGDRSPSQDRSAEGRPAKPYGTKSFGDRSGGFNRDERRPEQRRDERAPTDRPAYGDRSPQQDRSAEGRPAKPYGAKSFGDRSGGFNRDERRPEQRRDERAPSDRPAYGDRSPSQDRPADRNAPKPYGAKSFGERDRSGGFNRDERQSEPRRDERPASARSFSKPAQGGGTARHAAPAVAPDAFDWTAIQHFYAPCPRGLEQLLADELTRLGADAVLAGEGGVAFEGKAELMYVVNLHSRFASRIMLRLDERAYRNEADLYRLGSRTDWPALFDVSRTIKVNVTAQRSGLRSIDFIALKMKDAVCDIFRAATDERPSVDTHNPDIRINVFLTDRLATLYIDTSGEPLFKRGYRQESVEAPLRENLAAGLLALAGWNANEPLLDPMCGSGTFLIEAAMMALNMAPGRLREFGFQKLSSYDRAFWQQCKQESEAARRHELTFPIVGSDRDIHAIDSAMRNIEAAGVQDYIKVQVGDVLLAQPPADEGVLISNPPYGVRLDELEKLAGFYPQLGDSLKQRFSGWRAYLLTADMRLPKLIRLNATKRTPIYNGALDCRLYEFKVVAGSNREV